MLFMFLCNYLFIFYFVFIYFFKDHELTVFLNVSKFFIVMHKILRKEHIGTTTTSVVE